MSSDSKTFADKVGTAVRRNSPLAPKAIPASGGEFAEPQAAAQITRAGVKRWATNDISYWGAPETRNGLPAGYYRATSHPHLGPMLLKQSLKTDGLLELPDDATAAILAEFELETWVRLSAGFSLAHLKEMIVAVRCFGQALESVVTRLEEMHERQPTSEDTANVKAGFLTAHRNGHAHQ